VGPILNYGILSTVSIFHPLISRTLGPLKHLVCKKFVSDADVKQAVTWLQIFDIGGTNAYMSMVITLESGVYHLLQRAMNTSKSE
jgi:hypothetical protein